MKRSIVILMLFVIYILSNNYLSVSTHLMIYINKRTINDTLKVKIMTLLDNFATICVRGSKIMEYKFLFSVNCLNFVFN